MGKNQNTWSHRTKIIFREINIIFHPFGSLAGFPTELSFFDRKTSEALGTHHLQATVTMLLWMWFLNVWDNVPMDLKYVCQQYFTCMCFLGFIWYNKTFLSCGFRKYENVFTHEYHIPLGSCPREIWYSWVNTFSHSPQWIWVFIELQNQYWPQPSASVNIILQVNKNSYSLLQKSVIAYYS
jgi:hypothetical protein